jgi:nitronate monooxygenase
VTEAVGFGFLGIVREPVDVIRSGVAALRARGIERFGVNLIPRVSDPVLLEAQVSACIDLGVPVIGLFWDIAPKLVARLRARLAHKW